MNPRRDVYVAADVDGTILVANASFLFGKFLYRKGKISGLQACLAGLVYFLHYIGLLSVKRLHTLLFRLIFSGRSVEDIESSADDFFAKYWQALVRPTMLAELATLRGQGARIALLSSSPDFLIRRVAQALNIDEVYATEYRSDRYGRYSSVGSICSGAEKARHVASLRGEYVVVAFSDSIVDRAMLENADEPVAVAPDRQLARLARSRNWRIIV